MGARAEWRFRSRRHERGPAYGRIILGAAVCVALAAAWRYTPLAEWITAERIIGWARALREYEWALATVVAFGPWLGFAYGMAGILIAALATCYAGRFLRRDTVKRLAGERLDRASSCWPVSWRRLSR
jgi:phospholipase D1/2